MFHCIELQIQQRKFTKLRQHVAVLQNDAHGMKLSGHLNVQSLSFIIITIIINIELIGLLLFLLLLLLLLLKS